MDADPTALSRWLITAGTLAYGVGPFVVDMNRTHLLHPKWTGHARFHLFWSAISQLAVAGLALGMVWKTTATGSDCRLAAIIGICSTSGFWIACVFRKAFGGTLHDPRGIPPFAGKLDMNLVAVLLIDMLLVAGFFTI